MKKIHILNLSAVLLTSVSFSMKPFSSITKLGKKVLTNQLNSNILNQRLSYLDLKYVNLSDSFLREKDDAVKNERRSVKKILNSNQNLFTNMPNILLRIISEDRDLYEIAFFNQSMHGNILDSILRIVNENAELDDISKLEKIVENIDPEIRELHKERIDLQFEKLESYLQSSIDLTKNLEIINNSDNSFFAPKTEARDKILLDLDLKSSNLSESFIIEMDDVSTSE